MLLRCIVFHPIKSGIEEPMAMAHFNWPPDGTKEYIEDSTAKKVDPPAPSLFQTLLFIPGPSLSPSLSLPGTDIGEIELLSSVLYTCVCVCVWRGKREKEKEKKVPSSGFFFFLSSRSETRLTRCWTRRKKKVLFFFFFFSFLNFSLLFVRWTNLVPVLLWMLHRFLHGRFLDKRESANSIALDKVVLLA